ncbi:hypothetical protein B0H98_11115 [Vreelandella songnenensis]|uniref:Uncharacterized protein n=1 Tax=Vreelandella songnenensis TaxID=1176243 RepID=A0A2T0UUL7_9GAMM|nr:hypothetical protein B0H98_11115 [Halomonas songnenensis]
MHFLYHFLIHVWLIQLEVLTAVGDISSNIYDFFHLFRGLINFSHRVGRPPFAIIF